jgi:hypothetical protein
VYIKKPGSQKATGFVELLLFKVPQPSFEGDGNNKTYGTTGGSENHGFDDVICLEGLEKACSYTAKQGCEGN